MDIIVDSFVDRFNTALKKRGIRPTELADKTKLSRSTISHYMSGYTQPKSDKLFILSKALNVSEQWLMGFDVPMERNTKKDIDIDLTGKTITTQIAYVIKKLLDEGSVTIENAETGELTTFSTKDFSSELSNGKSELLLLECYRLLNEMGQAKALEQLALLAKIPEYQVRNIHVLPESDKAYLEPQAAHERTDIKVTDEMRKHDDDIMDNDDFWK